MKVEINKPLRVVFGNDSCLVRHTDIGDKIVVCVVVRYEEEHIDIFIPENSEYFMVIQIRTDAARVLRFYGKVEDYYKGDQGVVGMMGIDCPAFFGFKYVYTILELQGYL